MLFLIVGIIVLILALYLGIRTGGLGIAYAAGLGLFIYTMVLGIAPGNIPINVVFIIMTVIGTIAVLELSGGLDYMVLIAEKILRSNPRYINVLAPITTFCLTVLVGTQHSSYSLMPVIIEIAKKNNIKPVRPLSTSIIAAQVGVTSSPVAAAVVAFSGLLIPLGISLPKLLLIVFPASLIAIVIVGLLQNLLPQALDKDKNYLQLLQNGNLKEIKAQNGLNKEVKKGAKLTVGLFLLSIVLIVIYASFPSLKPTYSNGYKIDNAQMIMITMLAIAYVMINFTKVKISDLVNQKTFKAGMSAAVCVIGVAWLGDTLITHYTHDINVIAGNVLTTYSWLFSIVLFVVAVFLYSQAATVAAIIPIAISLGLSPLTLVASFVAVNALFVLPTYPTVIAANQMDYTGTTKIGKYVFNHSFMLPGVLVIFFAVILAYIIAGVVL